MILQEKESESKHTLSSKLTNRSETDNNYEKKVLEQTNTLSPKTWKGRPLLRYHTRFVKPATNCAAEA